MVTYTDYLLPPKQKKKKNNNKPIPLKPDEVIEVKKGLKTAQDAGRELTEHCCSHKGPTVSLQQPHQTTHKCLNSSSRESNAFFLVSEHSKHT